MAIFLSNNIYKKRGPTNTIYGYGVKLTIFMTLDNCFPKILWISYVLHSFVKFLQSNDFVYKRTAELAILRGIIKT